MTCREARTAILGLVRGRATEADRLLLEEHLGACQACQVERGQWALVERVRDQPVRHLTPAARARVLQKIVAEAPRAPLAPEVPAGTSRRRAMVAVGGLAAAAALALGIQLLAARSPAHPVVVLGEGGGRHPYGHVVEGDRAGSVQVPGAQLWYPAGASVKLSSARRVDVARLGGGELEVDVTPGGRGRFRVHGPRFIIEVVGTRFVMRDGGMRTLHGTVRVLGLDERELAVVRDGERWELPVAAPTAIAPVATSAPTTAAPVSPGNPAALVGAATPVVQAAPPVSAGRGPARPASSRDAHPVAPRIAPTVSAGSPAPSPATAAELLSQARSALAAGRFDECRARIAASRAAAPTLAQQSKADMLLADLLRNEGQVDAAVVAYRDTAQRWAGSPDGEAASFTLAELLVERGSAAAARAALLDYLRRYHAGRFVDEVRQLLRDPRSEP